MEKYTRILDALSRLPPSRAMLLERIIEILGKADEAQAARIELALQAVVSAYSALIEDADGEAPDE